MTDFDDIKLEDYEAEDISDVIVKLEKSFCIKFDNKAFEVVKTFGELCDVVEANIRYDNQEDCTKQQAFYKIRKAISLTQLIRENQINLDTKLSDLFPRKNRRVQAREFQRQLGVKIKFLTYPNWLALTFIIGLLSSFVVFFFDWEIALSGTIFFILALKIADISGKDLEFETVKDLTEKAARANYVEMRRSKFSVNRNEILETIKAVFSNSLSIDKKHLAKDANFSWAKKH